MTISTLEDGSLDFITPSFFKRYKIRFSRFWHLYTDSPFGMIGFFLVLLFISMAIFAPVLAPYNPNTLMVGGRSDNPSVSHPLGTDRLGRDIFSQMIFGAQISLLIGLSAAFISLVIGTLFGLISGYYGGWIDIILMRITDFFIQIPTLPLMLVAASLFGNSLENLILIIGLLGWTGTARIVRSETLSLKQRAFVEASKSVGAGNRHIILGHILPNVFPLIFANAILGVVNSIIAEAGISFLGFGVPGSWSWGQVLYEAGRENAILLGSWWHFIPPGLSIMLLALGFSLISFSLNEVLNPRLRER